MKKFLKTAILFILIFFGGFFSYSPDANAAITFVARTLQGLGSSGGTTTAIDTTGANFCVLSITSYQQVEAPTPSDSKSNTWTPLTEYTQGTRVRIQIFYAENPTVGTGHTFTASAVVNSFSALGVACFSGMETSSVFQTGTDAGAGTSSSTLQPGSITPGTSPALVITATSGDTLSSPSSIDSSFDAQTLAFNNGVHFASGLAYLIQDPAATVNPTWTYAGSDNATAAIAAFKAVSERYWVGGTATWDGTAGSKWATTSGGAGGASVPTSSDDVYFDANSGTGTVTISSLAAANNLNFTGYTGQMQISGNFTVGSTLTIPGASITSRRFIKSNTVGTARTITVNGTVTASNVDFQDITGAGSASWNLSAITGGSGDAGGNSGITFTTGQTNYWVGSGGNWSDVNEWASSSGGVGGTGRVPLPQDDARFDANSVSSGSQTISADMPRLGKNVDWTGVTNTPTWSNATASTVYGSWTMVSGMTVSMPATLTFEGRGSHTLTSAGKTFNASITFAMFGGTMTLQDAMTVTGSILQITHGTFNANNFNVTANTFSSSASTARTVTMGSGTWTVTGTGNAWNLNTATNLTLNANTSTVVVSNTTATAKTFFGGNQTFNNVTFEGDNITVIGNNTFNILAVNNAGLTNGLKITSGTTQIVSNFTTNGSAGNLAKLLSVTGDSAATLSKSSGTVSVDYMSIQDSTATGGASWYAGANSTNVSGNTGWIFTAPPSGNPNTGTHDGASNTIRGGVKVRGGVKLR